MRLKTQNIFITPKTNKKDSHAYHLYPLQIDFSKLKISRKELFKKFISKSINLQVHYIPIHLQPFYKKKYNFKQGDFPISEKFYSREVSLPIYFTLKSKEVYKVVKHLKNFCKK